MSTYFSRIGKMAIASLFIAALQNVSIAQESNKEHSHAKAEIHGGSVAMSRQYHFEIVFKSDAIQVYIYDSVQKHLSAKRVVGEVTLKFKKGGFQKLPLNYASVQHGKADHLEGMKHEHKQKEERLEHHEKHLGMDYLQANVDLSKVEAGALKAVFTLKGLPNAKETEATFTGTFNGFAARNESQHEHHGEHKH